MKATTFSTVEEYISGFPAKTKALLKEMRKLIKETAPGAEEVISYNMPAFKKNGMLVYYAGNKAHIGFYPTSSPIRVFKDELIGYKTSKGAIQFPLDKPLPIGLITKIVKFRIVENNEKALAKKKK